MARKDRTKVIYKGTFISKQSLIHTAWLTVIYLWKSHFENSPFQWLEKKIKSNEMFYGNSWTIQLQKFWRLSILVHSQWFIHLIWIDFSKESLKQISSNCNPFIWFIKQQMGSHCSRTISNIILNLRSPWRRLSDDRNPTLAIAIIWGKHVKMKLLEIWSRVWISSSSSSLD